MARWFRDLRDNFHIAQGELLRFDVTGRMLVLGYLYIGMARSSKEGREVYKPVKGCTGTVSGMKVIEVSKEVSDVIILGKRLLLKVLIIYFPKQSNVA